MAIEGVRVGAVGLPAILSGGVELFAKESGSAVKLLSGKGAMSGWLSADLALPFARDKDPNHDDLGAAGMGGESDGRKAALELDAGSTLVMHIAGGLDESVACCVSATDTSVCGVGS